MSKIIPSIFNDVIGPVMRGPSSSHVAAASRIGRLIYMSSQNGIKEAIVDFDINGSLAESYDGHGSDIGLVSGLMGIDVTDEKVPKALKIAEETGLKVVFNILDYKAVHPNNYRMKITASNGEVHNWEAISTGGGMIEMQKLDGVDINICGDYYEALIMCTEEQSDKIRDLVFTVFNENEFILENSNNGKYIFEIKYAKPFGEELKKALDKVDKEYVIYLDPILPTRSSAKCEVPFETAEELFEFAKTSDREMWEMATLYESKRGNISEEEVFNEMSNLVDIMENCVRKGVKHNEYKDRILGQQSDMVDKAKRKNLLLPNELVNNIVRNVTAIMEMKSSMGVIIAAPTAGACAGLPGTMIALKDTYDLSHEEIVKGMLAAALIGIFIVNKSTFAAEVAGCQAECGSASGMAAAGIVQVFGGGNVEKCLDAASMALQAITGLVCDPVANRVEVPCLGKNIMAGSNAVSSATMALAGFDKVIPLDETIESIYDIGTKLPLEFRCTYGGLGKTPTSNRIRNQLENIEEE